MTHEEEMALRELAANPHYIAKVQDLLGPLSLWSSQGLQDHVRKAVEAEREACAKVADLVAREIDDTNGTSTYIAAAIRARGQALAQPKQDGDCKKCKDGCPACDARKIPNDLL